MHGHLTRTRNASTARSQQKRRLAKETKRDPISYCDLPLPKSIKDELIRGLIGAGLVVRRGVDEVGMSTAQWRRKSGLLIAQALVKLLVDKKGDALRFERFLSFIIAELESLE